METKSSGDELLKTSSKETNCLETKSRGTDILSFDKCVRHTINYLRDPAVVKIEQKEIMTSILPGACLTHRF